MLANRQGLVFDNALVNLHRTDHMNEKKKRTVGSQRRFDLFRLELLFQFLADENRLHAGAC